MTPQERNARVDQIVLDAIGRSVDKAGDITEELRAHAQGEPGLRPQHRPYFREVDAALQRLRKRRLIAYSGGAWRLEAER